MTDFTDPLADAARESARQDNGQSGTQTRAVVTDVELAMPRVDDVTCVHDGEHLRATRHNRAECPLSQQPAHRGPVSPVLTAEPA